MVKEDIVSEGKYGERTLKVKKRMKEDIVSKAGMVREDKSIGGRGWR
jgi:hypothetical protein